MVNSTNIFINIWPSIQLQYKSMDHQASSNIQTHLSTNHAQSSQVHINTQDDQDSKHCLLTEQQKKLIDGLNITKVNETQLALPNSRCQSVQPQYHRMQTDTHVDHSIANPNMQIDTGNTNVQIENRNPDLQNSSLDCPIDNYISQYNNSSSSHDSDQNIIQIYNQKQQKQSDDQQQQETIKQNQKKTIKYLLKILHLESFCLIVSFVVSVLILLAQIYIQIDYNKCDLKQLFEKGEERNTGSDCSLGSYILIKMRPIICVTYFYILITLIGINIYQYKNRKLVQYLFLIGLVIYISVECVFQSMNRYKIFSEYIVLLIIGILVFGYTRRHNVLILVQRFVQLFFYLMVLFALMYLTASVRDTRNFYQFMMMQHLTLVVKKISQIFLKQRLKANMQYDDICVYYISLVIMEYTFIFNFLLIQNNSLFRQLVAILNFILLQTQNITNINIFYFSYQFMLHKFSRFLKKQNFISFQTLIVMHYLIMICMAIYQLVLLVIENLYISIFLLILTKICHKYFNKDNQYALSKNQIAISINGYLEQKIEESEIKDFTSQQSLIAYLYFTVFQLLFIIVNVAFPVTNLEYLYIYQLNSAPNNGNNMSLLNVFVFNILQFVLIILLVSKKVHGQEIKIIKQPIKYQVYILQLIISISFVCMVDKILFETQYMMQAFTI